MANTNLLFNGLYATLTSPVAIRFGTDQVVSVSDRAEVTGHVFGVNETTWIGSDNAAIDAMASQYGLFWTLSEGAEISVVGHPEGGVLYTTDKWQATVVLPTSSGGGVAAKDSGAVITIVTPAEAGLFASVSDRVVISVSMPISRGQFLSVSDQASVSIATESLPGNTLAVTNSEQIDTTASQEGVALLMTEPYITEISSLSSPEYGSFVTVSDAPEIVSATSSTGTGMGLLINDFLDIHSLSGAQTGARLDVAGYDSVSAVSYSTDLYFHLLDKASNSSSIVQYGAYLNGADQATVTSALNTEGGHMNVSDYISISATTTQEGIGVVAAENTDVSATSTSYYIMDAVFTLPELNIQCNAAPFPLLNASITQNLSVKATIGTGDGIRVKQNINIRAFMTAGLTGHMPHTLKTKMSVIQPMFAAVPHTMSVKGSLVKASTNTASVKQDIKITARLLPLVEMNAAVSHEIDFKGVIPAFVLNKARIGVPLYDFNLKMRDTENISARVASELSIKGFITTGMKSRVTHSIGVDAQIEDPKYRMHGKIHIPLLNIAARTETSFVARIESEMAIRANMLLRGEMDARFTMGVKIKGALSEDRSIRARVPLQYTLDAKLKELPPLKARVEVPTHDFTSKLMERISFSAKIGVPVHHIRMGDKPVNNAKVKLRHKIHMTVSDTPAITEDYYR